jgi:CO/xanthine dehydrogenase FAD-binding subunit
MTVYARPADLQTALALAAQGRVVLAGGTDLYPQAGTELAGDVLDITGVDALRGISRGDGLRIGGCTTWSEIAEASLPPALAGLQAAARVVGGRQVQNVGTLAGNLCNASPAADGVPPLLTLGAEVELASLRGVRRMGVGDFLTGPRKTARQADEVLVAVHIPAAAMQGKAAFEKLGARAYLVISIASVAVRCVTIGGLVTDIAIAAGACSGVAQRLPLVEAALLGASVEGLAARVRAADVAAALSPIADIRASAGYRLTAATELVARAVEAAL